MRAQTIFGYLFFFNFNFILFFKVIFSVFCVIRIVYKSSRTIQIDSGVNYHYYYCGGGGLCLCIYAFSGFDTEFHNFPHVDRMMAPFGSEFHVVAHAIDVMTRALHEMQLHGLFPFSVCESNP